MTNILGKPLELRLKQRGESVRRCVRPCRLATIDAMVGARGHEDVPVTALVLDATHDRLTMWARDEGQANRPGDREGSTRGARVRSSAPKRSVGRPE